MNWNDIRSGKIKLNISDLIFTRGNSAFGKAIRWATKSRGESNTIVNHVAGVTAISISDNLVNYTITEALSRVRSCSIYEYNNNQDDIIIFRAIWLDSASKWFIAEKVKDSIGQIYSPLRIIGQLADALINKILPKNCRISFFDRITVPFSKICSVLWSMPYSEFGFKFGAISAQGLDPDEMMDYCLSHPDEFELVFMTDGIEKLMKKKKHFFI